MHPYGPSSPEPAELGEGRGSAREQNTVEALDTTSPLGSAHGAEARPWAREQSEAERKASRELEARTRAREQSNERAARSLLAAIRELARARTGPAIAKIVKQAASELVSADGSTFVLREGDACVCADEETFAPLWQDRRFPLSECIGGLAMESGEQVVVPDIYADSRVLPENFRATFVRSMVLTPVPGDPCSAAIGTFWASARTPTSHELSLLRDLADATAIATQNAELYTELERRVEVRTLELREANRDLEAFSYSVAHDLRAPLSAMLVTRSLLERSYGAALDRQGIKLLQDIEHSGKRMSELIGGLLQFARSSRMELEKQAVDLSAIATRVALLLRQQDAARKLRLQIEPRLLSYADPALLEVVLSNLLNNAFKYTRERSYAEIYVGRAADFDRRVDKSADGPGVHSGARSASWPTQKEQVFFVRDNGVGFDARSDTELFRPFKRFHSPLQFEGHGVGLATAVRIIERHGGRLWVDTAPDHGATFYFSLPDAEARQMLA